MSRQKPIFEQVHLSRERDALSIAEKEQAVGLLTEQLDLGRLQFIEAGSLGSKDSAHDVFFAKNEEDQAIAIKRFRRADNAIRELDAMQEAHNRGFTTLQPVGEGVYPLSEKLGHAMVTARVPRFKTMNQLGWQNWYAGSPAYEKTAETLDSILEFVAAMHGAGIIHKDLQLKNVATVPPRRFVLFDLEGAQFYEPGSDDYHYQSGCAEDLRDIGLSLVSHGFLYSATDGVFAEELSKHVLDPYISNHASETVFDAWDSIVEEALYQREHGHKPVVNVAAGSVAIRQTVA